MGIRSTTLIARKSIRARLGRMIAIALAVTAGVSFVVGSFVLADSLRATFNDLFGELNEEIDLSVRAAVAIESDSSVEPIPLSIADDLRDVEGVDVVEPALFRYAQLIDADGDAIAPQGAPTFGTSFTGDDGIQGITLKDGTAPVGADQVAIDKATADLEGFEIGDQIEYLTDAGRFSGRISGFIGLGDADSFAGAQLTALDFDTARERFGAGDQVDTIEIKVDDGADVATVQQRVADVLPERAEVVTGEVAAEENEDDVSGFIDIFGTFLLVFAFITAFVSAFIINNVFQITIGQRLRELALLRAVGASGRQVRRMIVGEALIIGIVATLLGVLGGIGVARLLIFLFNQAGAGFPSSATILAPRTVVMAAIVGVGITLLSVWVPARRAARIPPVAAMRPEIGFQAMRARRLVIGVVVTALGAAMFLVGVFVSPGGTVGLVALAGGGALLLFLGVAGVSSTIASPVTRLIGWPVEKLLKVPGALARQNVARAPRRTSSSAAALMIGVSLVSAAAVFASSLRATFVDVLENSITADYVISTDNFQGLPPAIGQTLRDTPEIGAISPVRPFDALIFDDRINGAALDFTSLGDVFDPDLTDGTLDVGLDEVIVRGAVADDEDLDLGSSVDVTYANGTESRLTVVGIYENQQFGDWLVGTNTLAEYSSAPSPDFVIFAQLADGVDAADGDEIVNGALADFPQATIETSAQFRQSQEDQVNQVLIIISALLMFAIVIAVLGISITLGLGVLERTREIGLLRAVGMNRRQTRRSVRWEAIIVSTFGAIIGIVLGTFLGVVLSLAVPNDFVDRLAFSPFIIAAILVGAVVAGFLAALYPSSKASNLDLLTAIATE